MSLQDIFYLMSIIYMSLLIVILIVVAALMFFLMKKIGEISDNINSQITKVGRITSNAEEISSSVTAVATGAIRKVSSLIGEKKSKN
jgi:hypothetical protein